MVEGSGKDGWLERHRVQTLRLYARKEGFSVEHGVSTRTAERAEEGKGRSRGWASHRPQM